MSQIGILVVKSDIGIITCIMYCIWCSM